MAFADNNNALFSSEYKLSDTKDIKFQVLENKKSGQLSLSIREFVHSDAYNGPGKNGMFFKVDTLDDVNNISKEFSNFFDNAKKYLS